MVGSSRCSCCPWAGPGETEAVVLLGSALQCDLGYVVWLLPHTCSRGKLYLISGICTGQWAQQAKALWICRINRKQVTGQ